VSIVVLLDTVFGSFHVVLTNGRNEYGDNMLTKVQR